jgi:hypothetical protein
MRLYRHSAEAADETYSERGTAFEPRPEPQDAPPFERLRIICPNCGGQPAGCSRCDHGWAK